jgi:hypothetical protein
MQVIGYIHICQLGDWKRSFNMLMTRIRESGLYSVATEFRCGVVSPTGTITQDEIFMDPKIKIVCSGYSQEYERPTLLHMRNSAEIDGDNKRYLYLHTKGLRWFGTSKEPFVVDWINLLLYWNVNKWRDALSMLETYDTYGCNYYCKDNVWPHHYSGNFFWTTPKHLKTLPRYIGPGYNDPEFWLCSNKPKVHNAFTSGLEGMGHYDTPFPESIYKK